MFCLQSTHAKHGDFNEVSYVRVLPLFPCSAGQISGSKEGGHAKAENIVFHSLHRLEVPSPLEGAVWIASGIPTSIRPLNAVARPRHPQDRAGLTCYREQSSVSGYRAVSTRTPNGKFKPVNGLYFVVDIGTIPDILMVMKPIFWIISGFLSGQVVFWVALAANTVWRSFKSVVNGN